MGLDEVGTARTLREHRKITDALVAKHGGRLVKTTGDGVLLEFPSVVDAVECAVAVQAVMDQRNEGVPQDQRMLFRIGINLGDILIDGDDILGDGVNIAARLEGIAEPGGVCISSFAYDQVRGKVAVEFADLGDKELIDRAVELNPNLVQAQANGGWISLWQGHPELAIEQLRRAQRLDPASDSFLLPMAHASFFLERYEEALDQAQHLLRRHPDAHAALRVGAASAAFAGRADVAHQLASHLLEVDPTFSVSRLNEYLGPYQRPEFAEKYAEGLRRAGLPEVSSVATTARSD
jgi:hypothetical protein